MIADPKRNWLRRAAHRTQLAATVAALVVLLGCAGTEQGQTAATKPAKPAPTGGIGGTGFADNGLGGTGMDQERPGGLGGTGLAERRPGGIGGSGLESGQPGGIGGTGLADQRAGGIGGTGLSEGGIGGTGLANWGQVPSGGIGGTGIVGVLTDGQTVRVNGLSIRIEPGTSIRLGGAAMPQTELAAGHVVAIHVEDRGGRAVARTIEVAPALDGPVQSVNTGTGMMTVLGQHVAASDATALPDGKLPEAGSMIRVNGLARADGTIVASRIGRLDSAAPARLVGKLLPQDAGWMVSGVPVRFADGLDARSRSGRNVSVAGRWDGTTLDATALEGDPVDSLLARVAQVFVQGYLDTTGKDATIQVGRSRLPVSLASARVESGLSSASSDQLVVLSGTIAPDGTINATAVNPVRRTGGAFGSTPGGAPPSDAKAGGGGSGNPNRPFFAGSGNPWGGPPQSPPKGPPPGVPGRGGGGGGHGPPCGTPPCGKGPPK